MGILHNVLDAVLCITPEKRLAALQIEASSAAPVKFVNYRSGFLKAHGAVTTTRDLAVPAAEIAFIGEYQPANERDSPVQEMALQHVLNAVSDRLHGINPRILAPGAPQLTVIQPAGWENHGYDKDRTVDSATLIYIAAFGH